MKTSLLVFVLLVGSVFAQTFTSTTPYHCLAGPTEAFPITDPSTQHCQGIPYFQDPENPDYYHVVMRTYTDLSTVLVQGNALTWTQQGPWVPYASTDITETSQNCPADPLPNSTQPTKTCGTFKFTAYPVDLDGVTHMVNFEGNWLNHHPASGIIGRWNYLEYTSSTTTVN